MKTKMPLLIFFRQAWLVIGHRGAEAQRKDNTGDGTALITFSLRSVSLCLCGKLIRLIKRRELRYEAFARVQPRRLRRRHCPIAASAWSSAADKLFGCVGAKAARRFPLTALLL